MYMCIGNMSKLLSHAHLSCTVSTYTPSPPLPFQHTSNPFLSLSLYPQHSSPSLRVIVEGVTLPDWSSQLVHIKRSFLRLLPLIADNRGKGIYNGYVHVQCTMYVSVLHLNELTPRGQAVPSC